jgi:hypothetical protein
VAPARFSSFGEFWPFYLGQHRKRLTRQLHFIGTDFALGAIISAVWRRDPWLLAIGIVGAYGLAWLSHFFVERNRPATFQYPLWSFAADWKMWALIWTGGLHRNMRRHGLDPWIERPDARAAANESGPITRVQ